MILRRTIQWLTTLVLCAALGGGGYAWWLWDQRDLLLEASLNEKLPDLLPGWNIQFGRVHFDWHRRIHVHDVNVSVGDPPRTILTMPELLISVDRQQLTQNQQIVIQKIRFVSPTVEVTRDPDGHWNWQDLPPLRPLNRGSPEFEIEQGTVRVRFQNAAGAPASQLTFRQIEAKLIPSARRAYLIKGATHVHQAGFLALDGKIDLESKTWSLDGSLRDVVTNGDLLHLAAGISPELRKNLSRIDEALQKVRLALTDEPERPGHAVAWASSTKAPFIVPASSRSVRSTETEIPDFGIAAMMNVGFHADQKSADQPPAFQLRVGLREGHIRNDVLPFPIEDVEGELVWDNERIEIRRIAGRNGLTRIVFGGQLDRIEGLAPGAFGLRIENLSLDERVRCRLPAMARKIYDTLQPSGAIDVQGIVRYDGQSKWTPEDLVITARGCSVAYVKFPYPVTDIVGTVTQKGEDLKLLFEGRAGRRPLLVEGTVHQPGPMAEAAFDISVRQLPLDETLISSCPPAVQSSLRSLNMQGFADGNVRLYRPPGEGRKLEWQLAATVQRASMQYLHFPYRLTDLTGNLSFSSADGVWSFLDMKARHGPARLSGAGSFTKEPEGGPGRLELTLTASDATLDPDLQRSLPPAVRKAWDDLSLSGTIQTVKADVEWTPGEKPRITIPKLQLTRGSLMPRAFPMQIDRVETSLRWSDGRLEIEEFSGRHDETPLQSKGFCEISQEGDWRLRLNDAVARNVYFDQSLRNALPPGLLALVDQANIQGPIGLAGMLELRGSAHPGDPVTAAWDATATLPGNHLQAGLDLKNVRGSVTSYGTWNGRIADMNGAVDLDTVTVLDHQIDRVKGPYRFRDKHLTLGSPDAMLPDRNPRPVPLDQRVTGKAIGGLITLDATATFVETTIWNAKMSLNQGRLEEYAARYIPGTQNLRGVMTGWIDLQGAGPSTRQMSGKGKLQISPAALYELPVMVQMFRVLSLTTQDRTAFKYAYTDFTIERSQFRFQVIDLVGDALSLRGRGTAGMDGQLNLDFYSMMPRSRIAIPILDFVVGEATKGWVGVEVRGQVSAPVARVKAVPQVDDAVKQFLRAFNPRAAAPLAPNPGF